MAVGSVVNAIAILRHLAASSEGAGVNAVARALDLGPSTCFNILKTLVGERVVEFDAVTKKYSVGDDPGALLAVSAVDRVITTVSESLESLAADSLLVCGIWEVRGPRSHLRHVVESELPTRIHLARGQRLPRYLGAMGRCLAALDGLDRPAVAKTIESLRWQHAPSVASYLEEMRRTSAHGWAMDDGCYIRGVVTVAAPVLDPRGAPGACLTATMFQQQHSPERIAAIGERLAHIAHAARDRLAGTGTSMAASGGRRQNSHAVGASTGG